MTRLNLAGRIAVITGAASGIGRATALLLGRNGAKLHLADIDGARVDTVAGQVRAAGGEATAHTLDVSDAQALEAFADDRVRSRAGRGRAAQQRRHRPRREHRGDDIRGLASASSA